MVQPSNNQPSSIVRIYELLLSNSQQIIIADVLTLRCRMNRGLDTVNTITHANALATHLVNIASNRSRPRPLVRSDVQQIQL